MTDWLTPEELFPLSSKWGRRLCALLGHRFRFMFHPEPHRTCVFCGKEKIYD